MKLELLRSDSETIKQMLDAVSTILDAYKHAFQRLLLYTCSEQFDGVVGFEYDSLLRLKLAETHIKSRIDED